MEAINVLSLGMPLNKFQINEKIKGKKMKPQLNQRII